MGGGGGGGGGGWSYPSQPMVGCAQLPPDLNGLQQAVYEGLLGKGLNN